VRQTWRMAAVPLLFCLFLCGCAFPVEPPAPGPSCCGGLPLPVSRVDEVLPNTGFTVGYSDGRKDPLWVCYEVCTVANPVAHDRPSRFSVDLRTVALVSHDSYTNTGYDRGHMAPNATIDYCYGREAQLETFLMSNVCPQTPKLNRGIWATLEGYEREWANEYGELWVITGPVFDTDIQKLPSGVEIPDAFYKIILREGNGSPSVLAFVIPQDVQSGSNLAGYLTSVDSVELGTGFDFLSALPDSVETVIEAKVAGVLWSTSSSGGSPSPPSPPAGSPCNCSGPDLDCSDFHTQAEAQACFDYCQQHGYGDVFRLDGDGDGKACESLP